MSFEECRSIDPNFINQLSNEELLSLLDLAKISTFEDLDLLSEECRQFAIEFVTSIARDRGLLPAKIDLQTFIAFASIAGIAIAGIFFATRSK